jgi:acyl-CoA thioesterase
MPFEHTLDVRVRERHDDGVTCECAIRTELLNSQGVLHGGVIACIADEAAWWAIDVHTPNGKTCTTTELKVNYLLPMTGEKVVARAVLLRVGKHLCVSRVDMSADGGRLAAVAIVTYMFLQ